MLSPRSTPSNHWNLRWSWDCWHNWCQKWDSLAPLWLTETRWVRCLVKGRSGGMMKFCCLGRLWNHPWYERVAKLLSVWKELPRKFENDRSNRSRVGSLNPLATKVGGETAQPGWHLWFLFLPPIGNRKGPELSFGWTKNVKWWCWFPLQPRGNS